MVVGPASLVFLLCSIFWLPLLIYVDAAAISFTVETPSAALVSECSVPVSVPANSYTRQYNDSTGTPWLAVGCQSKYQLWVDNHLSPSPQLQVICGKNDTELKDQLLECRLVECSDPPVVPNSDDIHYTDKPYGQGFILVYPCRNGYYAVTTNGKHMNEVTASCDVSGNWNFVGGVHECTTLTCKPPDFQSYGLPLSVSPMRSSYNPGDVALLRCPVGFWFKPDVWSVPVMCNKDSSWLKPNDRCVLVTCGLSTLPVISEGVRYDNSSAISHIEESGQKGVPVGDQVKFTCQESYHMSDGLTEHSVTCLPSSQWDVPLGVSCMPDSPPTTSTSSMPQHSPSAAPVESNDISGPSESGLLFDIATVTHPRISGDTSSSASDRPASVPTIPTTEQGQESIVDGTAPDDDANSKSTSSDRTSHTTTSVPVESNDISRPSGAGLLFSVDTVTVFHNSGGTSSGPNHPASVSVFSTTEQGQSSSVDAALSADYEKSIPTSLDDASYTSSGNNPTILIPSISTATFSNLDIPRGATSVYGNSQHPSVSLNSQKTTRPPDKHISPKTTTDPEPSRPRTHAFTSSSQQPTEPDPSSRLVSLINKIRQVYNRQPSFESILRQMKKYGKMYEEQLRRQAQNSLSTTHTPDEGSTIIVSSPVTSESSPSTKLTLHDVISSSSMPPVGRFTSSKLRNFADALKSSTSSKSPEQTASKTTIAEASKYSPNAGNGKVVAQAHKSHKIVHPTTRQSSKPPVIAKPTSHSTTSRTQKSFSNKDADSVGEEPAVRGHLVHSGSLTAMSNDRSPAIRRNGIIIGTVMGILALLASISMLVDLVKQHLKQSREVESEPTANLKLDESNTYFSSQTAMPTRNACNDNVTNVNNKLSTRSAQIQCSPVADSVHTSRSPELPSTTILVRPIYPSDSSSSLRSPPAKLTRRQLPTPRLSSASSSTSSNTNLSDISMVSRNSPVLEQRPFTREEAMFAEMVKLDLSFLSSDDDCMSKKTNRKSKCQVADNPADPSIYTNVNNETSISLAGYWSDLTEVQLPSPYSKAQQPWNWHSLFAETTDSESIKSWRANSPVGSAQLPAHLAGTPNAVTSLTCDSDSDRSCMEASLQESVLRLQRSRPYPSSHLFDRKVNRAVSSNLSTAANDCVLMIEGDGTMPAVDI